MSAKLISCIVPDDGTERRLLHALRTEQGLTRANGIYCRGISMLRDSLASPGELPEPTLVRLLQVVVDAAQADALFEFIHTRANINRDGGGVMFQTALAAATSFVMPPGIPDEAEHG